LELAITEDRGIHEDHGEGFAMQLWGSQGDSSYFVSLNHHSGPAWKILNVTFIWEETEVQRMWHP
jgi:hypothetical protein